MKAELIRMQVCQPSDPCYVAREWHGLQGEAATKPLGTCWKVLLSQSGEAVGDAGLLILDEVDRVAEIYYRLEPESQQHAVLVSALRALVELGFAELDLLKIQAWSLGGETEIHEAYLEAGLELEEVLAESRCVMGTWHDSHLFSRSRATG